MHDLIWNGSVKLENKAKVQKIINKAFCLSRKCGIYKNDISH